jgi:hypothetical protein
MAGMTEVASAHRCYGDLAAWWPPISPRELFVGHRPRS